MEKTKIREIILTPEHYKSDFLKIVNKRNYVEFVVYCDGTGFDCKLHKSKLLEMLK